MKESMNMRRLSTKPRKDDYEDIDTNDFFLTELIWSLNCVDKSSCPVVVGDSEMLAKKDYKSTFVTDFFYRDFTEVADQLVDERWIVQDKTKNAILETTACWAGSKRCNYITTIFLLK